MELLMAEIRAPPLATHSFELIVLQGSDSKTYEMALIIAGILVPPPISSITSKLIPFCLSSSEKL
jgi:hypothetical protein